MYKEINMLNSIKKFFGFGNSATTEVKTPEAPYKVPDPVPTIVPVADASAVIVTQAAPTTPETPAPKVAKPKAPAKPKAEKAPAAPKAPKAPRTTKAKSA